MTDDRSCGRGAPEVRRIPLPAMTRAELKTLAMSRDERCTCYFHTVDKQTFLVWTPNICPAHPSNPPAVARRWDETLVIAPDSTGIDPT
jgi:hypothetical protein